jgi:hypothetical protein
LDLRDHSGGCPQDEPAKPLLTLILIQLSRFLKVTPRWMRPVTSDRFEDLDPAAFLQSFDCRRVAIATDHQVYRGIGNP